MKKIISIVLVGILVFSLTACGTKEKEASSSPNPTTGVTEAAGTVKTLKEGILKVGMQVDYPPFEQYDSDGITPVGLDCDIIEAIAKDMSLKVEYVDTAWDGIFAGLDTNKYDCIISGVTITDERKAKYDFTQSYIQNYQCMVTMKKGKVTAKKPEDLNGLKVGYQSETTSDIFVTDLIKKGVKATPNEYEKILECFTDLKLGRIDAVICDSTVTYPYLKDADSPYQKVWQQQDSPEEFGIMVKKGNSALLKALEDGVTKLKGDGSLEKYMDTWFSK